MQNELQIKSKLKKDKWIKMNTRDSWTKGSWTVRFYKDDIEVFDSIDKSGLYYLGNVRVFNIDPILEEINDRIKKDK